MEVDLTENLNKLDMWTNNNYSVDLQFSASVSKFCLSFQVCQVLFCMKNKRHSANFYVMTLKA